MKENELRESFRALAVRLTSNEIKLVVFILTALVAGALVKQYRATHRAALPPAPLSSRVPRL